MDFKTIIAQEEQQKLAEAQQKMMGELIEKWCDMKKFHSFENESGVRKFVELLQAIGYRGLNDFLADNSGCIEKMIDWIGNQNIPEWKDKLQDEVGGDEEEDEDH